MKINISKKSSTSLPTRVVLIFISLVIAIAVPIQITQKVSADQYDDKIAALQKDITKYQSEAARLISEADTLQSALAQLANQKAAIQTQINISQAQYDQLLIKIAETKKKIKNNQDALGVTIANMYVEGNITPIEMLAGSKNISDYMDKQEYQSSVRDQLSSTIATVKKLKVELDKQQIDVGKILEDQKSQRATLVARENEQQRLLDATRGDEAAYQQMISSSLNSIAEARAIQAALNQRGTRTGGYTLLDGGLNPGYITDSKFGSWTDYNCAMGGYDNGQWISFASTQGVNGSGGDGRGYGCRQCASYVAWRISKETGDYPSWGNAINFTTQAQAKYGVGDGQAHAGSIAVLDVGSYGHVAWVESEPYVNSQGQTVIQVSQYNFDYGQGFGMYSLMELSVNFFDHYIKVVK